MPISFLPRDMLKALRVDDFNEEADRQQLAYNPAPPEPEPEPAPVVPATPSFSLPSWDDVKIGAGQAAQQVTGAVQGAGEAVQQAAGAFKMPAWESFKLGGPSNQQQIAQNAGPAGAASLPEWSTIKFPDTEGTVGPGASSLGTAAGGDEVTQAARTAGVDPDLFGRLVGQESGGDQGAVSSMGAAGAAQLMPETAQYLAKKYGLDTSTRLGNLTAGAYYLKEQLDHFGGDVSKALAAYNAGPGAVESGEADTFPETQRYVQRVGGGYTGSGRAARPESTPASAQSPYDIAFDYDQPYGDAQFNPEIGRHRGVDLVLRGAENNGRGSPVAAFRGGTVVALTQDPNGGSGVILQGEDGLYDRYFHFDGVNVRQGQQIAPGETIGILGASGTEGFPHVHYEVSKNLNGDPVGQTIDPRPFMAGGGGQDAPEGSHERPLMMSSGDEVPDKGAGLRGRQAYEPQSSTPVRDDWSQTWAPTYGGQNGRPQDAAWPGLDDTLGDVQSRLSTALPPSTPIGYGGFARTAGADTPGTVAGMTTFEDAGGTARFNPAQIIVDNMGVPVSEGKDPLSDDSLRDIARALAYVVAHEVTHGDVLDHGPAFRAADAPRQSLTSGDVDQIYRSLVQMRETGQLDRAAETAKANRWNGYSDESGAAIPDKGAGLISRQAYEPSGDSERGPFDPPGYGQQPEPEPEPSLGDRIKRGLNDASSAVTGALNQTASDIGNQFSPRTEPTAPSFESDEGPGPAAPLIEPVVKLPGRISEAAQPTPEEAAQRDASLAWTEAYNLPEPFKSTLLGMQSVQDKIRYLEGLLGPSVIPGTIAETIVKPLLQQLKAEHHIDTPLGEFGTTDLVIGAIPGVGQLGPLGRAGAFGERVLRPSQTVLGGAAARAGGALADTSVGQAVGTGVRRAGQFIGELNQARENLTRGLPGGAPVASAADNTGLAPDRSMPVGDPALAAEADRLSTGRQGGGRTAGPSAGIVGESDRYYHGTGRGFDTPDPATFDENGLFGPGYYLTSDPRVAGGQVQDTGRVGTVGYAQRGLNNGPPINQVSWDDTSKILREVATNGRVAALTRDSLLELADYVDGPGRRFYSSPMYLFDEVQKRVPRTTWAKISAAVENGVPGYQPPAPNVRAVDVPRGLRLLDADQPALLDEARSISDHIHDPNATRDFDIHVFPNDEKTSVNPDLTGEDLYKHLLLALNRREMDFVQRSGRSPVTGAKTLTNRILAASGFDGIQHRGGQRIPMKDAAGNDIEHDVTIVFPKSLPKITNATSGRPGGLLPSASPIAQRLVGQAIGGAVYGGYQASQEEGATPESVIRAGGLNAAASVARGAIGRRGSVQMLARAVQRAGEESGAAPGARTWASSVENPNQRYDFHYEVRPLYDLTTSNTDALRPNPNYPAELQPRIRDRAASQAQINEIAAKLAPDSLLAETHRVDSGAPIIDAEGIVESGNGRAMALRLAHQQHPERFAEYQASLREQAVALGIDPATLDSTPNPVLVRVRDTALTPEQRIAFTSDANQRIGLDLSPYEKAVQDAQRLSPETLSALQVSESQSIDQALMSAGNRDVIRGIMATISPNERAGLMTATGELNEAGIVRIKNALFTATYPGDAGRRLSRTFTESPDPGVKNIESGMFSSLPAMGRAEGLIRAGERDADLSLSNDLAAAVDVLARLRQERMSVRDYIDQGSMFERELTPLQETLLSHLDSLSRAPRRIRDFIQNYGNAVESEPDPRQAGLFGDVPRVAKGDLIDRASGGATDAAATAEQTLQPGLLDFERPAEPAAAPAPEAPAAPQAGHGLEEPGPRAVPAEASGAGVAPATAAAPTTPPSPATNPPPTGLNPALRRYSPQYSPPAGQPSSPSGAQPSAPTPSPRQITSVPPVQRPAPPAGPPPPGGAQMRLPGNPGGTPPPPIGTLYNQPGPAPQGNTLANRLEQARRGFVRAWTDRQVDASILQKEAAGRIAKAQGRPLDADEMFTELSRLNPNDAAKIRVQDGLRPAIQSVGDDRLLLSELLTYRDNVDVAAAMGNPNRKFSFGLTAQESAQRIQQLEQQVGPARWQKLEDASRQVQDFVESYRKRMVDSGVWTQDTYNLFKQRYPNYTPTRILDYMQDPAHIPVGKSLNVRERGIHANSFDGTERAREDPLASLVRYAYDAEAIIRKNTALNGLLNLRDADPELQQLIRRVPTSYSKKNTEQLVTGFVNGERQQFAMPSALAPVVTAEPGAHLPGLAGTMLQGVMNLFRAGTTTRNPTFLVANSALDAAGYAVRESTRAGGPQHLPRLMTQLASSYADAFQGLLSGTYKGDTARFLREGGGQFGFFNRNESGAREAVKDLARRNVFEIKDAGDVKRLLGGLLTLKPVEAIGERIELAPRVAAMRNAERRGANQTQSIINGRTVTMDFAQGGNVAKVVNQFVPFFNVGIQGAATMPRAFRENPAAFVASGAALLTGPTLAAEAWNRSDEQRKKDYDDVPGYLKDSGIVIMLPGEAPKDAQGNRRPQFLHIRTREYTPFVTLTRQAAAKAWGDDTRPWADMLAGTFSTVSPVQGNNPADVLTGFTPLGVSTGLQLGFNRDAFRDRNIATESGDERASALSKGISAATGNRIRPSQAEFAARDLGGGVGGMVLAGSDLATGKGAPDARPQSIPGAGGMIGRFQKDAIGDRLDRTEGTAGITDQRVLDTMRQANVNIIPPPFEVPHPTIPGASIQLTRAEQERYQEAVRDHLQANIKPGATADRIEDIQRFARERAKLAVLKAIPLDDPRRKPLQAVGAR